MGSFLNGKLGQLAQRGAKLNIYKVEGMAFKPQILARMDELNVSQLVNQGLYSDNTPTPRYSPLTKAIKRSEGKIYNHMTFRDTGKTLASITYEWHDGLLIYVNDRFNLLNKYSKNILGLTNSNKRMMYPKIKTNLINAIKESIFHI